MKTATSVLAVALLICPAPAAAAETLRGQATVVAPHVLEIEGRLFRLNSVESLSGSRPRYCVPSIAFPEHPSEVLFTGRDQQRALEDLVRGHDVECRLALPEEEQRNPPPRLRSRFYTTDGQLVLLGDCFLDGKSVSLTLIERGLAPFGGGAVNDPLLAEKSRAERRAKNAGIGPLGKSKACLGIPGWTYDQVDAARAR